MLCALLYSPSLLRGQLPRKTLEEVVDILLHNTDNEQSSDVFVEYHKPRMTSTNLLAILKHYGGFPYSE